MAEERFSLFEIIIIACFISLIFSPVGIALMWIKSHWSKKIKIIVSGGFAFLYLLLIVLFTVLTSTSESGGGGGKPFIGIEMNSDSGGGYGNSQEYKPKSKSSKSNKKGSEKSNTSTASESFVQEVTKSRWFYVLLLFAIMLAIIIFRNIKWNGAPKNSSNPYVDISLYKIPIPEDFVFPEIKFSKYSPKPDERICFATPAEVKTNPGDIVITDKQFLFLGKKENYNFALNELTAIYSLSNTTLSLSVGEKTYYFFIPDTQMRFVLQIVRYLCEV